MHSLAQQNAGMTPRAGLVFEPVVRAHVPPHRGSLADLDKNPWTVILLRGRTLHKFFTMIDVEPESRPLVAYCPAVHDAEAVRLCDLDPTGFPAFGETLHVIAFERAVFHQVCAMPRHSQLTVEAADDATHRISLSGNTGSHSIRPLDRAVLHQIVAAFHLECR